MALELSEYKMIRQIGTGAGSKIFLAKHLRTGKPYAIKHVIRNSAEDDKFLEQMEIEYEVSHNLDNPYLRHSYSIHRGRKLISTNEIMVVMDYIDGLPLDKALPNRLNSFLIVFRKIAAGLHAMHELGYVHSDIKPNNIMVANGGLLKIIDFGQSCKMHTKKERIQGTPNYIAPEQVRRMPLDQRTDVFNLGASMYWVLTSENYPTALRGTDMTGGHNLISADKPIAPIEWNDKIPVSLSNLVMECCRDNPGERPADMKLVDSRLAVVQEIWKKQLAKTKNKPQPESNNDEPNDSNTMKDLE